MLDEVRDPIHYINLDQKGKKAQLKNKKIELILHLYREFSRARILWYEEILCVQEVGTPFI